MIHLRMSGQLLLAAAGAPRPPHTHVVLHLDGRAAQELWFVDPRTFGEMVVFDPDQRRRRAARAGPARASIRSPTVSIAADLRAACSAPRDGS